MFAASDNYVNCGKLAHSHLCTPNKEMLEECVFTGTTKMNLDKNNKCEQCNDNEEIERQSHI
jgi:hypothetical protein